MEYSLQKFNENANLKSITLTEIIDRLNLIGFEIDDVFNERSILNHFSFEIRFLIKIPANREDLLSENFLLTELSTIFLVDLFTIWKKINKNYMFLLKKHSSQYKNLHIVPFETKVPSMLVYSIQLKNLKFVNSPVWIQRKIHQMGLKSKNTIEDLLTLVNSESGTLFRFLSIPHVGEEKKNINKNFSNVYNNDEIEKGLIFTDPIDMLRSVESSNQIDLNFFDPEKKTFLQAFFYDIRVDNNNLKNYLGKGSLKILRKSFLSTFKSSFERLLTLLEVIYSISFDHNIYSNISTCLINIEKNRILKLEKISLKNFLNIEKINSSIFETAGLKIVCETRTAFYFNIPSFRNDIKREIDLIEEYSRFFGYKNFYPLFPTLVENKQKEKEKSIKYTKEFFLTQGFTEALSSSLEDSRILKKLAVVLSNPLTQESSSLRASLLPKLIEVFEKNIDNSNNLGNFFEIGRVFNKSENKKFIFEKNKLAGIFQLKLLKKEKKITNEWFAAKGLIENYLKSYGYTNLTLKKCSQESIVYHKTKSVDIFSKDIFLGKFGEIDPKYSIFSNVKYSIYIFELNVEKLENWKLQSELKLIKDSSKYPSVIKDLSLSVTKQVDFYHLKKRIQSNLKDLKDCNFFDIFFDEKNETKVNIGIRFQFQSEIETLRTENIESQILNLRALLSKEFEAEFN